MYFQIWIFQRSLPQIFINTKDSYEMYVSAGYDDSVR